MKFPYFLFLTWLSILVILIFAQLSFILPLTLPLPSYVKTTLIYQIRICVHMCTYINCNGDILLNLQLVRAHFRNF